MASPLTRIPFVREEHDPYGPCIADDDRALDNAAFAPAIRRVAYRFESLGVSSGDTVAVMLPNCSEIVTSMFAAWLHGAAMTPVNPALTDDEVRYQLRDSAASVVVGDERARSLAESIGVAWLDVGSVHELAKTELPERAPAAEASDFALVIYTSGTTGKPKGVVLDHRNLDAMSTSIIEHFTLTEADSSLLVLPLFHVNGLVLSVLSVLRAGGNVVVAPHFSPNTFWELVEDHRPTYSPPCRRSTPSSGPGRSRGGRLVTPVRHLWCRADGDRAARFTSCPFTSAFCDARHMCRNTPPHTCCRTCLPDLLSRGPPRSQSRVRLPGHPGGDLGARCEAQLGEDPFDVAVGGALRDDQVLGDLAVR